eukprot:jgi/Orpsp1_1/1177610/evm.model.c7180000062132.1
MNQETGYNIKEDLNTIKANIAVSQLLDVSPKVRAELIKYLKLNKDESTVNLIHKGRIAISKCKIYDVPSKVYLDYGAGINLISKSYLEKLPNIPKPVGVATSSIIQVLSDVDPTPGLIYQLPLTIGNTTFETQFRLVEKEDLLFDIIISYETIVENYLFINPVTFELCKINSNLGAAQIKELFKEVKEKYELWEVVEQLEELDRSDENFSTKEGEIVSLLLTSDHRSKELTNSNQTKFKIDDFDHEILVYNFKDSNERKETLNRIYKEGIGITDSNFLNKIKELLNSYDDIIALSTDDLSETKLLPHSIQLVENCKPLKQRSYRLSKAKADILKQELSKLINKKLIVPSHSTWSSPIILVPKKNGKWRLCVDYRKLNELTIKDAYSLPFIEEILFSVGGDIQAISTIDLFSGYHQIPMKQEDIDKTCFTTMYGNYNFVVMPFGLTNAPATFQREMNRIFFPLIGKCMFVYLDDLVIFSKSEEEHLKDLNDVFRIIKDNGLKVNIEKCHFFMKEVEVLGHMLTTKGIKPVSAKIEVIIAWEVPKDVSKLRSFLGTVGYYRKFIPNFSKVANCLYSLLKKGQEFIWSEECQSSFETLKNCIANYPILKFPDFAKPFIIRTDASYTGLGGVLLQKYDNKEFPIHYVSRTIKKEEKNYSVTKLEGAAAYYCVMKFKSYITGNEFETILYTDHKPLVGLFKNKEPTEKQLINWILEFSMLKINVQYEEGKKNVIADALSRLSRNELEETIPVSSITPLMDNYINSKFIINEGEEYYKDGDNLRKVIKDENLKAKLLHQAHQVGHEGFLKTYNRLKRDFYWPRMSRDVNLIVKTCHKCQLFRPKPYPKNAEDIATPAEAPFVR